MTGYKTKDGSFITGGVQTQPVKSVLPMNANDDVMDQNLNNPVKNLVGAQ